MTLEKYSYESNKWLWTFPAKHKVNCQEFPLWYPFSDDNIWLWTFAPYILYGLPSPELIKPKFFLELKVHSSKDLQFPSFLSNQVLNLSDIVSNLATISTIIFSLCFWVFFSFLFSFLNIKINLKRELPCNSSLISVGRLTVKRSG